MFFAFLSLLAFCCTGVSLGWSMKTLKDEAIDERIMTYRTGDVTVVLLDAHGQPIANEEVTVEQLNHEFLFGGNIFMIHSLPKDKGEAYARRFQELFNYSTLPVYWGAYDARQVRKMAEWCKAHGIKTKAHPLIWHEVVPNWPPKDPNRSEPIIKERIKSIANNLNGLTEYYDVINESLSSGSFDNCVGRWVKQHGPVEAARRAFVWTREAAPDAKLIINDYNNSPQFVSQIKELKKAGIIPDAIGLQSHMHQGVWDSATLWTICERFAALEVPIHFTEMTVLSGNLKTDNDWMSYHPGWNTTPKGEEAQAKALRRIYRLLFSHPSVEAITYWDFSDEGAWQGAPAGLLRKDMTPKPAYDELFKLIRTDWWTKPLKLKTDANGTIEFTGFYGDYQLLFHDKPITFTHSKNGSRRISIRVEQSELLP